MACNNPLVEDIQLDTEIKAELSKEAEISANITQIIVALSEAYLLLVSLVFPFRTSSLNISYGFTVTTSALAHPMMRQPAVLKSQLVLKSSHAFSLLDVVTLTERVRYRGRIGILQGSSRIERHSAYSFKSSYISIVLPRKRSSKCLSSCQSAVY